jgi:cytochrome c553
VKPGRLAALLAAALLAWPALAGEVAAGRAKANACAVCHGPLGLATLPDAPNLAGQSAIYLAAQLKAYRGGARQHEVMSLMAKTLSDADIDDLASWYSSLKVRVEPVP